MSRHPPAAHTLPPRTSQHDRPFDEVDVEIGSMLLAGDSINKDEFVALPAEKGCSMRLTDLLVWAGLRIDESQLVEQLTTRTKPHALQLVGEAIDGMSRHQAAGYVRARLGMMIRREISQSIKKPARSRHCNDLFQVIVANLTRELIAARQSQYEVVTSRAA